jgi:hypothetical protein
MNRRNYGGASGVIVDVCTVHGTWFDTGELPRVLAFVEGGGLAAARRREMEALQKARQDRTGLGALPLAPGPTEFSGASASLEIAQGVLELLKLVVSSLRLRMGR